RTDPGRGGRQYPQRHVPRIGSDPFPDEGQGKRPQQGRRRKALRLQAIARQRDQVHSPVGQGRGRDRTRTGDHGRMETHSRHGRRENREGSHDLWPGRLRRGGRRWNDRRRRYVRASGFDHARVVIRCGRNDGGQRLGAAGGHGAQPVDGVGADAGRGHHAFRHSLRLVCQPGLRLGALGTLGRRAHLGQPARSGNAIGVEEDTMKAMDVMVRDVVTVKPETDVASAIKLLIEHDISALPVVDDGGKVVGVISEADLVRRTGIGTEKQRPWWLEALTPGSMLAAEFAKAHGLRVSEIMSPHVVSASEETSLEEIATLLEKHRIKRVPIIEDGKLVGIVSRSNLIQALASSLQAEPAEETDREIRQELLSRLADQDWTDFRSRNIIVTGGVVHLWGLVGSPEERTALISLAEGVRGVVGVSDEMIPSYS